MKYRKKPEYVEAVPFQNTKEGKAALCELGLDFVSIKESREGPVLTFENYFGPVSAMEGDYIVKSGRWFTVMEKNNFERTYEAVQ